MKVLNSSIRVCLHPGGRRPRALMKRRTEAQDALY
jgi:hypothetical protein